MIKALVCLLALLFVAQYQVVAQMNIHTENQQWFQYYNETQLTDKLSINSDFGIRTINHFSNLNTLLLRSGLGYKLANHFTGNTGLAVFNTYSNNTLTRFELRAFQDFGKINEYEKYNIRNRFRVEARYFENISNDESSNHSAFNFRFRYAINFQISILKLSKLNTDRKILFNIGDEVLINAGKEIVYNTLDNNRFITGLSYQENKNLRLNLLFNYQLGQRNQPNSLQQSNVFWLTINHKIPTGSNE